MDTLGLMLEPNYSRHKGQVGMVQHAALKMLAESNLNADSSFTLQFNSKCDARELRPVNYSGRVVVSNALIQQLSQPMLEPTLEPSIA